MLKITYLKSDQVANEKNEDMTLEDYLEEGNRKFNLGPFVGNRIRTKTVAMTTDAGELWFEQAAREGRLL